MTASESALLAQWGTLSHHQLPTAKPTQEPPAQVTILPSLIGMKKNHRQQQTKALPHILELVFPPGRGPVPSCPTPPMAPTHPLRTTMKSMTFQPLRRYEPLWKTNPRATILIPASKQKIPMK